MKRVLLIAIMAVAPIIGAFAQENSYYGPTERWPYLWGPFQSAIIHFDKGSDLNAEINICAADGHMHYLDNGIILESDTKGVTGVEVGSTKYIADSEEMLEIISENSNGCIAKLSTIDLLEMGKADIGYGMSSSTYAADNLDLTAISGLVEGLLHAKVAEAALNIGEGEVYPIKDVYYIIVGKTRIEANKVEFQNLVGKELASTFLKANKVKWTKPETLLPVVDFIASTIK